MANKLSFTKIAYEWLEEHSLSIRFNTLNAYKSKLKRLCSDFGDEDLSKFTPHQIQKYLNNLYIYDHFSKSTIEKYKLTLSQIFDYAVFNEYIYINPCKKCKIPKKAVEKKVDALTETEIKQIINSIGKHELSLYANMLLFLGLRRSEALALSWGDIDWEKRCVKINKLIYFDVNKPCLFYGLKNGDKERFVPICDRLYEILIKYKGNTGIIFKQDGGYFKKSYITAMWRNYIDAINLDVTQHRLRHTFATILFNAGVDIKTAQYIMGHRDVTVLLGVYTHLQEKQKIKNINDLNEYINQNF